VHHGADNAALQPVRTGSGSAVERGQLRHRRKSRTEGHMGLARRRQTHVRPWRLTAMLYLLPAAVLYLSFALLPWAQSLWYSLYNWDGVGPRTWAGLGNYIQVFEQPFLRSSLEHAFGFIIFFSGVPICVGLVLAAIMAGRKSVGSSLTRTLLLIPQILPPVAVATAWTLLYAQSGPVNQLLRAVGLGRLTTAWLGSFTWAYPAVGIVGTWTTTGLCFLLLFSGIQKIDLSLYEAARIDGAGRIGEFLRITIPSLRREIILCANVTIIIALTSFDLVYVMTGGGPGYSTMIAGVEIYRLAFSAGQVGTASALATLLSLIIVVIVICLNRLGREK
jgi:raffinose/stachyose/melibiose transport system permease protein